MRVRMFLRGEIMPVGYAQIGRRMRGKIMETLFQQMRARLPGFNPRAR